MSGAKRQKRITEAAKKARNTTTAQRHIQQAKEANAVGSLVKSSPVAPDLDQSQVEAILKQFDLSYSYGPFVGVSRLRRWERAERFGLNPPKEVKEILTCETYQKAMPNIDKDLWWDELNQ